MLHQCVLMAAAIGTAVGSENLIRMKLSQYQSRKVENLPQSELIAVRRAGRGPGAADDRRDLSP